ncbi:hypothetical protein Cni_G26078 [Canna indica]|uniref:C2H2-type domain-containing protein n=1 Tax=Canna indica TaxID=4628 RepID=A0AAQ3L1D2_9LILI|nr:hypothetical protein Cni_G26078 [Canna indica]
MLACGNRTLSFVASRPPPLAHAKAEFKCSICGKAFGSYQALGGHKASHRKLNASDGGAGEEVSAMSSSAASAFGSSAAVAGATSSGGKVHQCSVCFKTFPSRLSVGRTQEVPLRSEPQWRRSQRRGSINRVRGRELEPQGLRSERAGGAGVRVGRQQMVRGRGEGGRNAKPDAL